MNGGYSQKARIMVATDEDMRHRRPLSLNERVRRQVLALARNSATVLSHQMKAWASVTFSGTRHELVLQFDGEEAVFDGKAFIDELFDHEFRIPGQLVADAVVREVNQNFENEERLTLTVALLLLDEAQ